MASQLQKLPPATQNVLKLAACIGNQFDLATLAIVSEQTELEIATILWKALQEGLVIPLNQVYKFYQDSSLVIGHLSLENSEQKTIYKFLHDRVQQAAYSLIPKDEKQPVHLKIGRLLLNKTPEAKREERIFEIVGQLNMAIELMTQLTERQALAQFNWIASCKAKAATAYAVALEYANVGIRLLNEALWQNQYKLTLALHQVATEVAYLSGDLEQMETFANKVLSYAKTPLDRVSVYEVKIEAFTAQGQLADAIAAALTILQQLGVELPADPKQEDVAAAFQSVSDAIGDRLPAELLDLPETTDENVLAVARILTSAAPSAYLFEPLLYILVVLRKVYLSVVYGNGPTSTFGYVSYGILMCGAIKNLELGYEFGQLALDLLSHIQNSELTAKIFCLVYSFIRHWKMHLRETLHPLQNAYASGLDVGDLAFAGYSTHVYGFYSYYAGQNLTQLELEIAEYCEALKHLKQTVALAYCQLLRQVLLNLMGHGDDVVTLSGVAYNEQHQVIFYEATGDRNGLAFLWINKLVLSYLFSRFALAADSAEQARQHLDTVSAYIHVPIFHFYESLTYLALLPQCSATEQQQMGERIAANQAKLKDWAIHAPMNFQHKYDLVEAERYRVLGQRGEAIEYYDRAIAGAKEHGYIQEEALANELAAKFYLEWGKARIAQDYMIEAYYGYARWGSPAKIADLEQRYPKLLTSILQQERSALWLKETVFAGSIVTSTSSSSSVSNYLDLSAILKASQTLSGEIELDKLLSTLLHTVIQTAGADKCVLMVLEEDCLMVQASAKLVSLQEKRVFQIDSHVQQTPQPLQESCEVPISPINTVKRSLQSLVITNATEHPQFAIDPYIERQQPKSILCSPILHQGKLLGILYLENNLATGAFTRDRVELLNLLCAQAAISLENARLYQQAQQALVDLQHAQLQIVQSEKMSALGNLVAGVAHEINNPVGFIAGNLQPALDYIKDTFGLIDLYQQEYPNPSKEIQDEMEAIDWEYIREDLPKLVDSMKLGVQRIRDISTSLRTFSRTDKDYKVPFNLHEGIDSTILILKHRLKASESRPAIEVVKNYDHLPPIECFPGQLNQVFMNILANAIDSLEESFVKYKVSSANKKIPTITIRTYLTSSCSAQQMTHPRDNSVVIQIQDNGIGMTDEVKQKIFEHLFTTKAVGKGTGLGLAIARQIVVEKHNGKLSVNSVLGQGTEFCIELPA
ncbi:hypothetical protein WA1_09915 [Scytonema hofmannii PCC 7110]|uniref:histidine kinase n=2 Tax=Scytonema hofmannii TaxID=34078 RepID=A0A139WRI5_9CYAN|nr:hypothetical protein WA1_09915 [Scytonema hofmannii PCC 7110]